MKPNAKFFAASIALAITGVTLASAASRTDGTSRTYCHIESDPQGALMKLTPMVITSSKASGKSGTFKFEVRSAGSSGSTNVNQSGRFTIGTDGTATLGSTFLSSSGAVHEASISASFNGTTYECSETFGERI